MRAGVGRAWLAVGLGIAAATCSAEDHHVIVGLGDDANPVYVFSPAELTINVGDTVTFQSTGGARGPHNVHADDDSFRCAVGCDGDGHGGSGNLSYHWSATVPFDHVGDIPFHCDEHVDRGERGVIHVVQGSDPPASVPITPGFSGAWYDPTQSGHGILIEVLEANQLLAWWFTFTPQGEQTWFGNVGSINGNTATIEALSTQGGRWIPNFDHANVTQPVWGTLTFSFTDCNHGRVDFSGAMPGYDTGHMDLTRLVRPAGLSCP